MDLPQHLAETLQTASSPVVVLRPAQHSVPIVLASAHSGRAYSTEFLAAARLDPLRLRRSEDGFVDELFADAPHHGMPLVCATFPRAFCDANREAWELDPAMFTDKLPDWVNTASPRVVAGLGTLARVVASGDLIYRDKLPFQEAQRRVQTCWQPFHDALGGLVGQTREMFGACLLIDCHSMPSSAVPGRSSVDIVLGDAHGRACHPGVMRAVEALLRAEGLTVRRNDPYAGGYITRHYGQPRDGVQALQIEINRGLYMNETQIEKHDGFERLHAAMARVLASLNSGTMAGLLAAG